MNSKPIINKLLERLPPGWADLTEAEDKYSQIGIALPMQPDKFLQIEIRAPWDAQDFYQYISKEEQENFQTYFALRFVEVDETPHGEYTMDYFCSPNLFLVAEMAHAIPLDCLSEDPTELKVVGYLGIPLLFWKEKLIYGSKGTLPTGPKVLKLVTPTDYEGKRS